MFQSLFSPKSYYRNIFNPYLRLENPPVQEDYDNPVKLIVYSALGFRLLLLSEVFF